MPVLGPGIALHSRYDPLGEANRFLDRAIGSKCPSCILVLGGGEDWLSEAAKARFPNALVLSLQFDSSYRGLERPGADARWYPSDMDGLRDFLLGQLSGRTDGGVSVVLWKPSENAHPETSVRTLHIVRAALEEISSDTATLRFWSFRWIRNALRNFLEVRRFVRIDRIQGPIVVAAAGPSLEASLSSLLPYRGRVHLWALSSAAEACYAAGWPPDLLISTDAGLWSDRHFDAPRRYGGGATLPIAAPLTARIPSQLRSTHPILLLSQGQFAEKDLASAGKLPVFETPPRGTSAADAVCLALSSNAAPLLLAGFDMAGLDLRSHCRPYGFDSFVRLPERRQKPYLSLLWDRETQALPLRFGAWRRGRSFDLYASGLAAGHPQELYRLLPSPVPVPGTIPVQPDSLSSLFSRSPVSRVDWASVSVPNRRDKKAGEILSSWEREAELSIQKAPKEGLVQRSRLLLYALGGPEAAGFLAEAARMRFSPELSAKALQSVRQSVKILKAESL